MILQEVQVSVCVVTYNQENYIVECLESLLSQKTNFRFEIIIGEDCSTDRTREIVQEYIDRYPNLITAIFHEKNVGAVGNIKQVYKKAKGKYIAHIDGDDKALPDKLQKQFDLLEANPDCTICAHDVNLIDTKSKYINTKYNKITNKLDRLNFIKYGVSFCHSSKMFVNPLSKIFWDNLLIDNEMIDYEIHLESLRFGNFIYLNEVLGQYRILTGMSIEGGKVSKTLLNAPDRIFTNLLLEYNDHTTKEIIKKCHASSLLRLAAQIGIYELNVNKFRNMTFSSLKVKFFSFKQLIFLIGCLCPTLFIKILKFRYKIKY